MRTYLVLIPVMFTVFILASCSDSSTTTNNPGSSDLFTISSLELTSNVITSINSVHKVDKQSKINITYEGECNVTPSDSAARISISVLIAAANDTGAFTSYTTIYSTNSATVLRNGLNQDFDVSSYTPALGLKFEIAFIKNEPGLQRTIKLKNVKVKKV